VSNWFEFDESANVWGDATDDYRPPPWRIVAAPPVLAWFNQVIFTDDQLANPATTALRTLRENGPTLGRPFVDHIKGSILRNLKELRFGSSELGAFRVLFVFDPQRTAVLLASGDKSGQWSNWYAQAICTAEERYAVHLERRKAALTRKGRAE